MLETLLLISIVFWNVENFFAPEQFEGHGWSKRRFYTKCNAIAKTILLAGDTYNNGSPPDLVALAEVGDASVLRALIYATPLRKLDYGFVHYDSPDHRGIDCALLYRRSRLKPESSKPCHLYDSTGKLIRTRDILLAEFSGGTAVLVNHHPSRAGSGSGAKREMAMARLRYLADSLAGAGIGQIVAVGDFNDDVLPADGLAPADGGTIKFQGKWEKIDGCPILEGLHGKEYIFAAPHLTTRDSYGGEKPRRTFTGPRYMGGVSDHYPIVLILAPDTLMLPVSREHQGL